MKLGMKSSYIAIIAIAAIAGLAIAFWLLAIGPKREEASRLGAQVQEAKTSLAAHRTEVTQALEARRGFPVDYRQLVVLGKAVPGGDETASLLVQLDQIARRAGVEFDNFNLATVKGGGEGPPAAEEGGGGAPEPVSPTEAAASLLPLGASIGPAGLGVMPYTLSFEGSFFQIADFIRGLDSLVKTKSSQVSVDGRLVTIDGFSLAPAEDGGSTYLEASFEVTTYLTPPEQGVTAGATPAAPAPAAATPASTTTGGTP
jgi:Tfp pilus assembly protein PilO